MRAAVKIMVFFCLFAFLGGMSACTQVRKAEYVPSVDYSDDEYSAPIHFRNLRSALPIGAEIGTYHVGCGLLYTKAGRDFLQGLDQPSLRDMFSETLEMQGYDVVSRLNVVFEEEYEAELSRSQYVISGKIIDADIDLCTQGGMSILDLFAFASPGERGELYLQIEWAVYDSLRRKIVYKTVTDGYVHRRVANIEGLTLMINDAFGMAAHNLGANAHFHDLIFYGTKPPQDWKKKKRKEPPRLYDRNEVVEVDPLSPSVRPLQEHIERSRKVAVLVQARGHGSGFFITKQGHILTNQHVVGEASRVRIVTADREDMLIGEVLRRDAVRDVALIKLENMPKDLDIVTVPIQTAWPKVSADIYALGAPKRPKLSDTLTKGIVSAHRKKMKFGDEAALDYIQGDVSIHGGNSGGPLLDAYGNIVGMSVSGLYLHDGKRNASLNLFIPIENALKAMDITLNEE